MKIFLITLWSVILPGWLFPCYSQVKTLANSDTIFDYYSFINKSKPPAAEPFSIERLSAENNSIHKTRLYVVSGVTGLAMAGVYAAHIKPWWSGEKTGFRFKFDFYNNYWLEMDKFGHFFANIQVTKLSAAAFQLAGISRKNALWIGFIYSTLLYTGFELTDAGFQDWGFSVPDQIANLLGAAYPIAQEYYPVLRHLNFKMSYRPSRYFRNSEYRHAPGFIRYEPYEYLVGDYDGMIFWLNTDVDWMLPGMVKSYWPDWLNIAVGYGATNLPQANRNLKERHLYIALDYNLNRLPGEGALLTKMKGILNAIHFPAPAIKIGPAGTITYLVHY